MKINVTKKHIHTTERQNPHACMVHKAIEEAFPDVTLKGFRVFSDAIKIDDGEVWHATPEVTRAIDLYDEYLDNPAGEDAEPFSFELPDNFAKQLRAE